MSADLGRCYELLGVKPGVSLGELKAAHRDMAKVWHPDRFGHDPRLQLKAQEKLKEINEAFDLLISGEVSPRKPATRNDDEWKPRIDIRTESHVTRSSVSWQWAGIPILIFLVVFGFTLRSIINRNANRVDITGPAPDTTREQQRSVTSASKSEVSKEKREVDSAQSDPQASSATEIRPLPTTTVTIDPTSGLLARSDCPSKTRMTYPNGNEPHDYCGINHQQQPKSEVAQEETKTSRVKSLTKKLATKLNGETKSDDWSRQD